MSSFKEIASLIELKYAKDVNNIEHNWRVEFGGHYIGDLHDCDGIGGQLGEFTETDLFDYVCVLAKEDLESRCSYKPPHGAAPNREPDFVIRETNGDHTHIYWFKEMMMYNSHLKVMIPLRYDDEGDLVDGFNFQEGYWIDEGTLVLEEYKKYLGVNEILKTDKEHIQDAIDAIEEVISTDQHSTLLSGIQRKLEEYYSSME